MRNGSLFIVLVLSLSEFAVAADDKAAAAQPATPLDADFFLQGEYAGELQTSEGPATKTGLQVIALGDGRFQAVEYSGGLPGSGWNQQTRLKSTGSLVSRDVAELSGGGHRFIVRRGLAIVKDDAGKELGRLRKYERVSQTLHAAPESGAQVLFFGRDGREFKNGVVTFDHLLVAGAETRNPYSDFRMHLEFRTPYLPKARDQARGNSGVYIQGRYEVQILDSFGLDGAFNECGSLYRQRAPQVNMSFPPLAWQTYDIDFTAARFDETRKKTANARITVRLNGVVVQENVEIVAKTGAGAPEGADPRPIKLQDHGNAVHFRNIWIVEKKSTVDGKSDSQRDSCPVCPTDFAVNR